MGITLREFYGFLPNVLDTKIEANYVSENFSTGLKQRSETHLGYKQATFKETTRKAGPRDALPTGGRLIREWIEEAAPDGLEPTPMEERQYKMNELTAEEVFAYGCDDTICTAALHNYYKLIMELEHTWKVYLEVEIGAAYLGAAGFLQGVDISLEKLNELKAEDDATYGKAWAVFRDFLIEKGWEGTVCPEFTWKTEAAEVKQAFEIVVGRKMDTKMRKLDKLITHIREVEDQPSFAALLEDAVSSKDWVKFNEYVKGFFKGEPEFNTGSPKQKTTLLYQTLGLPIRVRNKPTDQMRSTGIKEGTPKTDSLAIRTALTFDVKDDSVRNVLESLRLIQMVETRRGLFTNPYRKFPHWNDGKIHSSFNQCATNTRRYTSSAPNLQQLSTREAIEGYSPRFREVIVPHHRDAVIVSMDFSGQELRIIADYSRDENMLACFIGETLKDIHGLTGFGILQKREPDAGWTYEKFMAIYNDPTHPLFKKVKEHRALGKTTVFAEAYGAAAPKLAQTMMVSEEDAQVFLDAKAAAFPSVNIWKETIVDQAKNTGIVRTKLGAVRHLREVLTSGDAYERSKAERQASNFVIQSSGGEMLRRAMCSMWDAGLIFKYDCSFVAVIHDEVVFSIVVKELVPFCQELHSLMTQPYADMVVPIKSSIGIGWNFGDLVEIGEEPTRVAIDAGLAELRKMSKPERLAA